MAEAILWQKHSWHIDSLLSIHNVLDTQFILTKAAHVSLTTVFMFVFPVTQAFYHIFQESTLTYSW